MKSRTLTYIVGITLFAALAIPVQLAAQHTRYKLIDSAVHAFLWRNGVITDLGTLGGPTSIVGLGYPLNNRDMVTGSSNISTPDPNGEDFCGIGSTSHLTNNLQTGSCLPDSAYYRARIGASYD